MIKKYHGDFENRRRLDKPSFPAPELENLRGQKNALVADLERRFTASENPEKREQKERLLEETLAVFKRLGKPLENSDWAIEFASRSITYSDTLRRFSSDLEVCSLKELRRYTVSIERERGVVGWSTGEGYEYKAIGVWHRGSLGNEYLTPKTFRISTGTQSIPKYGKVYSDIGLKLRPAHPVLRKIAITSLVVSGAWGIAYGFGCPPPQRLFSQDTEYSVDITACGSGLERYLCAEKFYREEIPPVTKSQLVDAFSAAGFSEWNPLDTRWGRKFEYERRTSGEKVEVSFELLRWEDYLPPDELISVRIQMGMNREQFRLFLAKEMPGVHPLGKK